MPQQNNSRQQDLRERTNRFAIEVIRFCRKLPNNAEGWVIGKQLLRSGTSVAANYRAAQRARSHAEFLAKIGIVVEEADETVFWLDLLGTAGTVPNDSIEKLRNEARELTAIFTSSYHTAKSKATGAR